jgi:hypothetical protein
MALLSYIQASASALAAGVQAAASVGGDTIPPNDHGGLVFRNGDASSKTITLVVPGNTEWGLANPDPTYVVVAGATCYIGPLPQRLADPTTGVVSFTYSPNVTACTVAAVAF